MKTTTTHTQGPWKRSAEATGCYIETADGLKVAGCFTDTKGVGGKRIGFLEAEANAQLIAAAPSMEATLQKVLRISLLMGTISEGAARLQERARITVESEQVTRQAIKDAREEIQAIIREARATLATAEVR